MNEWPIKVTLEQVQGGYRILRVFDGYDNVIMWDRKQPAAQSFHIKGIYQDKLTVADAVRNAFSVGEGDCQISFEIY